MRHLFLLVVIALTLGGTAVAYAAPQPQGITVVPAVKQLTLPNGSAPVHFTAQLTNTTARSVTLAVSAEDFTYLNQNGAIRFIEPGTATSGAHGLAAAIRFDSELLQLAPGQTSSVSLQIVHPDQLASGGHYAAVLYRQVDPTSPHGISIGLKPAVATLLFVTTAGEGSAGIRLATPVASGLATSVPTATSLVFADTGNTQTAVHGLVQVLAPSGEVVEQGIINVDSGLILPGAERLFTVALRATSSRPWWPGSYQLRVLYRHDGQTNYTSYTEGFVFVDGRILGVVGLGALVAVIVILRRVGPARFYNSRLRHGR